MREQLVKRVGHVPVAQVPGSRTIAEHCPVVLLGVYEAKLRIADVYEALGDASGAGRLRREAGALRAAFNEAFWNPEEEFFALALDGAKRARHVLWMGDQDPVERLAGV